MLQEEKQLLLKDLCCRLPYGVICHTEEGDGHLCSINQTIFGTEYGLNINPLKRDYFNDSETDEQAIKPYLRPMSSMTEEERDEIEVFIFNEWYQEDSCKIDKEGWIEILANYDVSGIDPRFCSDYVDWLNSHHFDFRNLIEKGLALEASEGMYEKK